MRVCLLLTLLLPTYAEYSLNFKSSVAGLTYEYDAPVDFTNVSMKFILHPDPAFTSNATNGIEQFITIESRLSDDGYIDFFYIDILPSNQAGSPTENMLMATFATPKSSGDLESLSYCLTVMPYDFSTSPKEITIMKTGTVFTLHIEGLDEPLAYYCANNDIGEPDTGAMTMSKITVSSYKGCISRLQFPEVDFLPPDQCGFVENYLIGGPGDIVYFEGQCVDGGTDVIAVCATDPPPTTSAPTTSSATETKPATEPATEADTTESIAQETTIVTVQRTTPEQVDPSVSLGPDNIVVPVPDPDDTDDNETENNETDGNVTDNNNPEYNVTIAEVKEEDKRNPADNKAVIIIICVVAAGIIVVVVLLYVGYRFHFRDKGSYKLDEAKTEQTDDFGNEYTDLNPTTKDQEWYL